MSDKIKQIKRKTKIPQIRLWLIWLFLFVFPCIMALVGFEIYCKKNAYFVRTDLIHKAYEDIKKTSMKLNLELILIPIYFL